MTVAVCWKCGEMKWGAFNACPKCHASPSSEDELAISLAMSDHYHDKSTLERMGQHVAEGKPMMLDPETRGALIRKIRDFALEMPAFKHAARAMDIDYEPPLPSKNPSWAIMLLKGFAYVWLTGAGLLILAGAIGVWMKGGLTAVQDVFSPFNVCNFIAVLITLAPGYLALKWAEKLSETARRGGNGNR